MRCPTCNGDTRVLESRAAEGGLAVRRRRACSACGRRFTTFERREREPVFVRKRDGRREPFDRAKLARGLLRAAYKRPVERADVERLVASIEAEAEAAGGELPAEHVGERALAGLRELDRIAYLQFAAVYRGFDDPSEFTDELRALGVTPLPQTDPAETPNLRGSGDRVPSGGGG